MHVVHPLTPSAETVACWWLRCRGFRIVARNWRVRGGEIDVVAARGGLTVFVEVKGRRHQAWADQACHPEQLARVQRAAWAFARTHPGLVGDVRFDVLMVSGRGPFRRVRRVRGVGADDISGGRPWRQR